MKAEEFIRFAGRIVTQGSAGARSAVSRAYYGVFHTAADLIEELTGQRCRSGKAHNLVSQFIEFSQHPHAKQAALAITDLHTERIQADYRLSSSEIESVDYAKACVETALRTQRLLAKLRSDCLADPKQLQKLSDGVARVKSIHQA